MKGSGWEKMSWKQQAEEIRTLITKNKNLMVESLRERWILRMEMGREREEREREKRKFEEELKGLKGQLSKLTGEEGTSENCWWERMTETHRIWREWKERERKLVKENITLRARVEELEEGVGRRDWWIRPTERE